MFGAVEEVFRGVRNAKLLPEVICGRDGRGAATNCIHAMNECCAVEDARTIRIARAQQQPVDRSWIHVNSRDSHTDDNASAVAFPGRAAVVNADDISVVDVRPDELDEEDGQESDYSANVQDDD